MRRIDPLGVTVTALLAAGHLTAYILLGVTIMNDADRSQAAASPPDAPMHLPDPPPEPGVA
ncbi:hypothetical protein [Streptomyces sp. NPDC001165]|uniref:hypothetical protein n=1 Tax=Streptomyces sp. NPDC001165 TaxID=3364546 RepID=UPI00368A56CB